MAGRYAIPFILVLLKAGQVFLGFHRCHAAESRRYNGLSKMLVVHFASRKHAGHVGVQI